ncbi:MAG: mersacidin/lichenicidin family type 2 lantibiotic [Ktedonobacteraceae bacterium]|nr:mersacidin/lichenicidin family type 2 lantibiotic [Ktedonobacteraceae bacterium]MBV9713497.1 mersacidin/lichenicidin family type 2 lantibiotic [Ktedonobacteraceae bacterium]
MNSNIVRAWKDEFYRQSLSEEERAQLPENPVGELELTDAELESVFAAAGYDEPGETRFHPNPDISFIRGGCYTHFVAQCVRPHFSYDWDDCRSYHYFVCHHYNTYDFSDCRTYRDRR